MKVDDSKVSALEAMLMPELTRLAGARGCGKLELFSHRHAEELHVVGIGGEVERPDGEFRLLVLRVAIIAIGEESIKGEVIWFRSKADFGSSDICWKVDGTTADAMHRFLDGWPNLVAAFEAAIARNTPLCFA